jgi:hypothetical protein
VRTGRATAAALGVLIGALAMLAGWAPRSPDLLFANSLSLVGVGGLRWSDVTEAGTPQLWVLTQHSVVGSLTVRAARAGTCPIDGWLTLNAGGRAAAPRPGGRCVPVPAPTPVPGNLDDRGSYRIADWARLTGDPPQGGSWGSLQGPLYEHQSHDCAFGPGGAVALAEADGFLAARYLTDPTSLSGACGRIVVDAGDLPADPQARSVALRTVDAMVGEFAQLGRAFLVAGISDSPGAGPELTVLAGRSPTVDPAHRPWLGSTSTRRRGLAQLTDLTVSLAGVPTGPALPGGLLESHLGSARQGDLLAAQTAARTMRQMFVPFFVAFAGAELLLFSAAWVGRRRAAARRLGLWFGSVAPASFVVNLLPWAHWRHPAVVVWAGTAVGATALALVAALGPWRRRPYGPAAFIGSVTAVGLAADVATGSGHQTDALFGLSPLIAGRFYGFGNITFGVYASCVLVAAAAMGRAVAARHGGRAGGVAVGFVGTAAALIDGWPGLGTDFGGFLSLLPGAAVLALGIAGIRLRVRVVLLVAGVACTLITGLALLDWQRPAGRRTHLGRFVQQVLDGEGPHEIGRKLSANVGLLHNPGTVVLLLALLAVVVPATVAPAALRLHGLARVQAADPAVRSLGVALLVTGLLGFALNDSGVIVPAVVLITGGPLLIAVWAALWAGATTHEAGRGRRPGRGSPCATRIRRRTGGSPPTSGLDPRTGRAWFGRAPGPAWRALGGMRPPFGRDHPPRLAYESAHSAYESAHSNHR